MHPLSSRPQITGEEKPVNADDIRSFRLTESTFLASLMPKKEIAADRFIEDHPEYDGRGVLIAIFDSGVDPAAAGLQVTSDGRPKILDILDCTGSGDVDTSKVVKADGDGFIVGASGARLVVNPSWKNPSYEWHVGCKLVYELFTDTLTTRLKKERKKIWDEKNQEAISEALKQLNDFEKAHAKNEGFKLKQMRDDLQHRLDFLKKEAERYTDRGPVIDVVVWNDGDHWRVAIDTQSFDDGSENEKLADFLPLTNYRIERKYGIFSKLDACSFVTNVYDEGNLVSIVTDCSPHGTHVAGIATAFHPKEPLLNGIAPGAQLISCKIGDTRLGSMETGTGLIRALIAAVEHKCDLVNMSYGEPTLLPDYGRFIDLVNEVVDKQRIIFICSAGNNGPALSTVTSPGGTTSSILGIGAYVSPEMAAAAHCVVKAPSEGSEYTWSSRGPTVDGNLGVCISAPGGAMAPVPTWTLQRRMFMNGTSMASPSACGGVALLLSGMKAEGITLSPYIVREALENTSLLIGDVPEDKLSTGHGLMQVDRAYEYLKQSHDLPRVYRKITISLAGKSAPATRGIYLRGAIDCHQMSEWTVQIEPRFHEGASNMKELVPFEECIQLHSSDDSVVQAPEYLLLTHNGRSFSLVVDPTKLSDGLHYHEVFGTDCKNPWRGPLFRVPVTIIKPIICKGQPPTVSFSNIPFVPGHIERRFIEVPLGCTWAEATMRTSGFDTARRFYFDTVQICPLVRPIRWRSDMTVQSPSYKSFRFPVKEGLPIELSVAQFWSSGIGSLESTVVDLELVFHGIETSPDDIFLDGSEAPRRIDVRSQLLSEKIVPVSTLSKVKTSYSPSDAKLSALLTNRDKLPSGKQIIALILSYKFKLEDGAEIKPHIPLLNDRIYDTKIESQLYRISDSNKRIYAFGDAYPEYVKLPKGDYILHLCIRHENVEVLEKMKQLVLFIEQKLDKKDHMQLNFYSQPDASIVGNGTLTSFILVPGQLEAFYVSPPSKEKIPKGARPGAVLLGSISYMSVESKNGDEDRKEVPVSYPISYLIPPPKVDDRKEKDRSTCTKSLSERIKEQVRDAKINILSDMKWGTEEERSAWTDFSSSLKVEYPGFTPLLTKILEGLVLEGLDKDNDRFCREIIDAANEVIDSIDKDELAKCLLLKPDPDDDDTEEMKKKIEVTRDHLAEALYRKGLALDELERFKPVAGPFASSMKIDAEESISKLDDMSDLFEQNFKELKKWVDVNSSKYSLLLVVWERRNGRFGTALKVLNDLIQDQPHPKKKLYNLKVELIDKIGWGHLSSYQRRWMHVLFPSSLPPF